jgi:hypothetical protein
MEFYPQMRSLDTAHWEVYCFLEEREDSTRKKTFSSGAIIWKPSKGAKIEHHELISQAEFEDGKPLFDRSLKPRPDPPGVFPPDPPHWIDFLRLGLA